MKQKIYYCPLPKIVKLLLNKSFAKPHETREFKLIKPWETFSFKPSINPGLHSNWMLGITGLEVYNSVFNKTEENNRFEL